MTSRKTTAAGLAFMSLAGISLSAVAIGQTPAPKAYGKLAAQAKVSLEAARTIATQAQAGVIKDWELEKEPGGSGLRYSFDIASGGKIHEVGVDAASGAILENVIETPADEAREAQEDNTSANSEADEDDEEDDDSN